MVISCSYYGCTNRIKTNYKRIKKRIKKKNQLENEGRSRFASESETASETGKKMDDSCETSIKNIQSSSVIHAPKNIFSSDSESFEKVKIVGISRQ